MGRSLPLPESYQDCLDFFFSRNQFAIKLGLDSIQTLLNKLGRPDADLTILHVAGTNGKGSVCANLTAMLQATGRKRVGLYTSPHLVSFRERIRVDGEPISADYILTWLRKAQAAILDINATYFECVTALALDYFKFKNCEAVVLETGLGGRLDATNAVHPAITVITSISLDHTSILGDTVEAIWVEKIGILKPGIPMVVAENRPVLLGILAEKANTKNCQVHKLLDHTWIESPDSEITFPGLYADYTLPARLRPEKHQKENLGLSLLAMECFLRGPLPKPEILLPYIQDAKLPGRTQWLEATDLLPVLLDGAHNPSGILALKTYLAQEFPQRPIITVFSIMRDKDFAPVFRDVLAFSAQVLFVPLYPKFPRALPLEELHAVLAPREREQVQGFSFSVANIENLLQGKLFENLSSPIIVVCGSLYLLGEIIPFLLPHFPQLKPFRNLVAEG